jgi:FtsZ-binding cell division protein ZapB
MRANRSGEHEQIQLLEAELKELKERYDVKVLELSYQKTANDDLEDEMEGQ